MTSDDEAFVRAIVAAPCDDAPRLVYADWLDERGDPRGAYLRLIVECADRLADPGLRDRTERRLRQAAQVLDAVWAARMSPPRVGVCSQSVRFRDAGTELSEARLDQLESRLNVRLPADYRAFLLNHNGGIPDPKSCFAGSEKFDLQSLHSIGEWFTSAGGQRYDDAFERHVEAYRRVNQDSEFIPIGTYAQEHFHHGGKGETQEVLLGVTGEQAGHVCLEIWWMRSARGYRHQSAAPTFAAFLDHLTDVPDGWEPPWV